MAIEYYYDDTAWKQCHIDDLWIFDKLILAKKLGYICGPAGVDVPSSGYYIVRPITNIMGMGIAADFMMLDDNTDDLPAGTFWCEVFKGRHLSVDYINKKQVLCVEGHKKDTAVIYKWDRWERVDDIIPYPPILETLKGDYKYINCEFIGGNLIEVHLRLNPNFTNGEQVLHVVWEGEDTTPPEGMVFVEEKDYKRQGFFIPKDDI